MLVIPYSVDELAVFTSYNMNAYSNVSQVKSSETTVSVLGGKKADTRKIILQAAAKMFRDQGYLATTLRGIASKAGLKAGSIYYHFSSKDDIVNEVLDIGLDSVDMAVREAVAQCEATASHREIIATAIRTHLKVVLSHVEFSAASIRLQGQLPEALRERENQRRNNYGDLWNGLLAAAQRSGELRQDIGVGLLCQFILGAMNWNIEWFDSKRSSVDVLADKIIQLVFDGIWAK